MLLGPPLAAVLSAVCYSASSLVKRKILRVEESDSLGYAIWVHLAGAALLAPLLFVLSFPFPAGLNAWLYALAAAFFWSVRTVLVYEATKRLSAPRLAVLIRFHLIWLVLLSVMLLGETLTAARVASLALILSGTLLVSWESGRKFGSLNRDALVVFAGVLAGAVATLADKVALSQFGIVAYSFWIYASIGIALLAYSGRLPQAHFSKLSGAKKWLAFDVVVDVANYLLFLYALQSGSVVVVALLFELNVPLTIMGGMFLLGERHDAKRVLFAAGLALAGGTLAII